MSAQAKLTQGQRKFLKAIYDGTGGVFHKSVVNPVFAAGYIFPRPGNFTFWLAGCCGHGASGFALLEPGYDALKANCPRLSPRAEQSAAA